MQHQFKAGDLALTLTECGEVATGSCVEVIRILPAGEIFEMQGRDHWHDWDTVLVFYHYERFLYRPHELMPLKGGQSPTQTNTETPKEVVHG